jgi:hypothetical protein
MAFRLSGMELYGKDKVELVHKDLQEVQEHKVLQVQQVHKGKKEHRHILVTLHQVVVS